MTPERLRALRERLGLSIAGFAKRYGLSRKTLENYEYRGNGIPLGTQQLFKLIEQDPELIAKMLREAKR